MNCSLVARLLIFASLSFAATACSNALTASSLISGAGADGTVAQVLATSWSGVKMFGGASSSGVHGITAGGMAMDSDDSMYVAASVFSGDAPGATFTGGHDVSLMKYDPFGNVIWTQSIVAIPADGAVVQLDPKRVRVDSQHHVWVLSQYTLVSGAGASVGGYLISSPLAMVLTEFDPDGNLLLSRAYDTYTGQLGELRTLAGDFDVDSSGYVYATGTIQIFMPNQGIYYPYLFTEKIDPAQGNLIWVHNTEATTGGIAIHIDRVDSGHSLVNVLGNTTGTGQSSTFDGYPLPIGFPGIVMIQYDTDGNKIWTAVDWMYNAKVYASSITTDASHHLYVAGTFLNADHAFEGLSNIGAWASPNSDVFLSRYTPTPAGAPAQTVSYVTGTVPIFSTHDWTLPYGAVNASTSGVSILIGSDQKLYLLGKTQNLSTSANLVGMLGAAAQPGASDLFLSRFDITASTPQSETFHLVTEQGDNGTVSAAGFAMDSHGAFFLQGTADGAVSGEASAAVSDAFLMKVTP